MGERLLQLFESYKHHFRTKTRDSSAHGLTMLKGYLLLDCKRNYVQIAQKMKGHTQDGQDLQHFMSDSPWEVGGIFGQVRQDIVQRLHLGGGMLNFDETGDACSGVHKVGASRQYLGREGKVDLGQVGVLSSYYKDGIWLLTDAELYLTQTWLNSFSSPEDKTKAFERYHLPLGRTYQSKIELAKAQFDRAVAENLPFEVAGGDAFYGRDSAFRRHIAQAGKYYMLCVPSDQSVWLENPLQTADLKGNLVQTVQQVAQSTPFKNLKVRNSERGVLEYEHAFVQVWTQNPSDDKTFIQETLVIRKEKNNTLSYALSNALDKDHLVIAQWRANRYFVERTIQDAKSELGFDELQALKYRAYMHSLALCALALVFLADTKSEQRNMHAPQNIVKEELKIPQLPDLSLANVKELMKAVFPMPQLTKQQAVEKIINTLFKRAKVTQYKLKNKSP
jgi:SRSO17 transposase